MKFCPECGLRLKKSSSDSTELSCSKCGYSEGGAGKDSNFTKNKQEQDQKEGKKKHEIIQETQTTSEFNVLEESDTKETLPSIKIDCEKCDNNEAVWWMLQTRSADEPTTQFYRCTKCNHTWRNYS